MKHEDELKQAIGSSENSFKEISFCSLYMLCDISR